MSEYSIRNIAHIVGGEFFGEGEIFINNILTDSRRLIFPLDTVFFAISGERHDGHTYIHELYDLGVRAFVVREYKDAYKSLVKANFILVENTIQALQALATYHRNQFEIPIVGITGSNGKTIVKEWLFDMLHHSKNVIRSPKSYNSQIGVPLSVWLLREDCEIACFEAGISKFGEMEKLERIVQPDIGIFTNIGEAHQENFSSTDEKINEKLKLFEKSKLLIYCKDYSEIDKQIKIKFKNNDIQFFTWSRESEAGLRIKEIKKELQKTLIVGIYKKQKLNIEIPFSDDASVENAIHVWAFMLSQSYDHNYIHERIKNIARVAMRLEQKEAVNNCTLINDSYNSDLTSLHIAIDFLIQQNQHTNKVVILSDILQSGRSQDDLYAQIANYLNNKGIDKIIGIGKNISENQDLFTIEKFFYRTTDEFISQISAHQFINSAILLKGARGFAFENISRLLELKIHKTVFEINLDALVHNLNFYRSKLKPTTKIMAMVKASSYGSGSYEIANLMQFQRVDYLAVAFSDEGIALRNAGVLLPILVLNPEQSSFDSIVQHNLEPEIYSFEGLEQFSKLVRKMHLKSYPIHVKIDSGMHRLGFGAEEVPKFLEEIGKCDNLVVKSIFSHLASSDNPDHDDYSREQIKLFEKLSQIIIDKLAYSVSRHILNTAGIERFLEAQYDMVRLGIGLYGISGENMNKLKNVGTLKSYISQIKRIPENETVGYGREWLSKKATKVGVVPIGYADGLSRKLSNGVGKFVVNGKFATIIGNICMDMCMIDITDIDAKNGDEVIIFGEELSIIDFANKLETIPYEILTSISNRVKRVYFQE